MPTTPLDDYGDPLPPAALARLGTLRLRHWPAPFGCFGLRDGSLLSIAESTWRIWDLTTGKLLRAIEEPFATLSPKPSNLPIMRDVMAMSQDIRWLAIDCWQHLVVWDLENQSIRLSIPNLEHRATALGFSPDNTLLTVVFPTGQIVSYDRASGAIRHAHTLRKGALAGASVSAADSLVVLCHQRGDMRALEWPSGKMRWRVCLKKDRARAVAIAPDGKRVAVGGSQSSMLTVFDSLTGAVVQRLPTRGKGIHSVAFAPDGQHLGCGNKSGKVQVWELASSRLAWETRVQESTIAGLTFSADGRQLIARNRSPILSVWDALTGTELLPLRGYSNSVEGLALAPGTGHVALAGGMSVELWDPVTRSRLSRLPGPRRNTMRVAFSPDGRLLAATTYDARVHLWDLQTGHRRVLRGHWYEASDVCFLEGGKLLATLEQAPSPGLVLLWDVAQGKPVKKLEGPAESYGDLEGLLDDLHEENPHPLTDNLLNLMPARSDVWHPRCMAGSPTEGLLAYGGSALGFGNSAIHLCAVADGHHAKLHMQQGVAVTALAFSTDGRTLASGGDDRQVVFWDLATQQGQRRQGHTAEITALAFAHDNRLLASGSADGVVRVWSVAARRELRHFTGHGGEVLGLGFTRDGKTLLSGSVDATVLFWDVGPLAS